MGASEEGLVMGGMGWGGVELWSEMYMPEVSDSNVVMMSSFVLG